METDTVEFIRQEEVNDLLRAFGISAHVEEGDVDRTHLVMSDSAAAAHLHLATPESDAEPHAGARITQIDGDRMAAVVEQIIQKLHRNELLLIPVGRWRKVFDAVAFSMADNETWQAIDAAASVELNSRDPLLVSAGEQQLLFELIRALLSDADDPSQGLMLVPTGAPLLMEIVPNGAIRIALGNEVLADEVAEAYA